MKKNRKGGVGIILKVLVLLIVLLTASFFLLYFEVYAGEKMTQVDPCLCRLSVDRAAATKILETESRFGLDCYTRFVNIYKADNYKLKEKGERIDYHISNTKELKDAFAREITLGYWEMGEGKDNPFPNFVTLTRGRNSRCVITSQITVDPKVINSFGSSLTDFQSHLIGYNFSECGVTKTANKILGDKISFDTIDMTRDGKPMTLSVVWSGTVTEGLQRARWITDVGAETAIIGAALHFIPGVNVIAGAITFVGATGTAGGIAYNVATIGDEVYLFTIAIGPADEVGKACGQLY